jgi:hypothetical protein
LTASTGPARAAAGIAAGMEADVTEALIAASFEQDFESGVGEFSPTPFCRFAA